MLKKGKVVIDLLSVFRARPKNENGREIFDGRALGMHLPLHPKADLREMAEKCYGYGRWDAPYWFIGLGEGIGQATVDQRAEAWHALEQDGLCDCCEFHQRIRETDWHNESPKPQKTWGQLIRLLGAFLNLNWNNEDIRHYQRKQWGTSNGVTCVAELFGLPAPEFKEYQKLASRLFTQEQISDILQCRIEFLRSKIQLHHPKFVVMYGRVARKQWNELAGFSLHDDEIYEFGSTLMVSATHPNDRHLKKRNEYWNNLGEKLRKRAASIFR